MKNFHAYSLSKQVPPEALPDLVMQLRSQKKRIATLNGSFDLLHAGHLQIIYEASQVADVLIVALNTDDSIKKYKSERRPIIALEYRLQMISALAFVDYVTWFDETDPIAFLKKVAPDVHVNGADWGADCIEAETVKQLGGKMHIVQLVPGLSTSAIVKKIHTLCV